MAGITDEGDFNYELFITIGDKRRKKLCREARILRNAMFFSDQEELRVTRPI